MKSSLILLFLIISAAAATVEFPNINSHIQLSWLGGIRTSFIDSSQTRSESGNLSYFTFCEDFFGNNGSQLTCTSEFSYSIETGDLKISDSGNGNRSNVYISSYRASQYCLLFKNEIPNFKEVYDAAEIGQGSWKHTWKCGENSSGFNWISFWAVIFVLLLAVVMVVSCHFYFKKYPRHGRMLSAWLDNPCCRGEYDF